MEYLIFNDSSIPFDTTEDVNNHFPEFLTIIDTALRNNFKAIRFCENIDSGWFRIRLTSELTLEEWLKLQQKDYRIKIKSFIQKTKSVLISKELTDLIERFELSGFTLENDNTCNTISLGASYYWNQLSVSCLSHPKWDNHILRINVKELTDAGEISSISEVKNCTTLLHWEKHLSAIDEERKESLRKGSELWDKREEQFPNLIFCKETQNQLCNLSISGGLYSQLWDSLTKLNNYGDLNSTNHSLNSIIENTRLNISDESVSIKENNRLRRKREFRIDGRRIFFGYHIKNFAEGFRLHFYPIFEKNKIHIGYFGKHL